MRSDVTMPVGALGVEPQSQHAALRLKNAATLDAVFWGIRFKNRLHWPNVSIALQSGIIVASQV